MKIKHIIVTILLLLSIYNLATGGMPPAEEPFVITLLFILSTIVIIMFIIGACIWTVDNWKTNKFLNKKL